MEYNGMCYIILGLKLEIFIKGHTDFYCTKNKYGNQKKFTTHQINQSIFFFYFVVKVLYLNTFTELFYKLAYLFTKTITISATFFTDH